MERCGQVQERGTVGGACTKWVELTGGGVEHVERVEFVERGWCL